MIMIRMAKHVPRPRKKRRRSSAMKKAGPQASQLASKHDTHSRKLKR